MKTKLYLSLAFLVVLVLTGFLSGCTVIGLGIGYEVDQSHKRNARISPQQINKLRLEQTIVVCSKDSTKTTGVYKGMTDLSDEEYRVNYNAFLKHHPNDTIIPQIGDTLTIFEKSTRSMVYGKLIAFEYNAVRLLKIENNKPRTFVLNDSIVVYNKKNWIDIARYSDFPKINIINMEGDDKKVYAFRINDIAYILPRYRKNSVLKWGLSGFFIDAIIVAIVAASISIDVY